MACTFRRRSTIIRSVSGAGSPRYRPRCCRAALHRCQQATPTPPPVGAARTFARPDERELRHLPSQTPAGPLELVSSGLGAVVGSSVDESELGTSTRNRPDSSMTMNCTVRRESATPTSTKCPRPICPAGSSFDETTSRPPTSWTKAAISARLDPRSSSDIFAVTSQAKSTSCATAACRRALTASTAVSRPLWHAPAAGSSSSEEHAVRASAKTETMARQLLRFTEYLSDVVAERVCCTNW